MTAKKNELLLKQKIKSKYHEYTTTQTLISSVSGKKEDVLNSLEVKLHPGSSFDILGCKQDHPDDI